jgi:hypothetical protein
MPKKVTTQEESWSKKLEQQQKRGHYIAVLKQKLSIGKEVELQYRKDAGKEKFVDHRAKIGKVVYINDCYFTVLDIRGFKESIKWNAVFCSDVKVIA